MNNKEQASLGKDTQVGMFVYFSRLMDRPVIDTRNRQVGEVYDVIIKSSGTVFPISHALIIRRGFPNRTYSVVPWENIADIDNREVRLGVEGEQLAFEEAHDVKEELTLRRDILDQQVIDSYNHKVIRVNDIHMLTVDHALMVAHVDISARGLLRRMGFEKLVDVFVRLVSPNARYLHTENLISWKFIQPLSINPASMTIKVDVPQKKLSSIPAADFGEIFQDLDLTHQVALFKSLDVATKAKIFTNIDFKAQESLFEEIEDKQAVELLNAMPSDEATDFLERMPKELTRKFLGLMESKQAKKLSELMGYSSDSAGGLMTKDFLSVLRGTPVEAVIKEIKERPVKVEPVQYVYIVDSEGRFTGVANYRRLIKADPADPVEKAAFTKTYCVHLDSDVKEVAYLMEKYKYNAIAVVDEKNVLRGIITVDDILSQLIAIAWRRLKRIKAMPQHAVQAAAAQTQQAQPAPGSAEHPPKPASEPPAQPPQQNP